MDDTPINDIPIIQDAPGTGGLDFVEQPESSGLDFTETPDPGPVAEAVSDKPVPSTLNPPDITIHPNPKGPEVLPSPEIEPISVPHAPEKPTPQAPVPEGGEPHGGGPEGGY